MEAFYSQAYLHDRFVGNISSGTKGRARRYGVNLAYFRTILPIIFGLALRGQRCDYLNTLVAAVDAKDTFLSFNYDCLIDEALRHTAGRRWRPDRGYGVNISQGIERWHVHAGTGRFPDPGIMLLKPHGSLNWQKTEQTAHPIALRADPYQAHDELMIVPPLWQKDFDNEPDRAIWTRARTVLSSTKAIIVVGYSLPETDVYTQAMLRIDVQKLDFLCVVNPDEGARRRIKSALRSAIAPSTFVVDFGELRDLAGALGPAPAAGDL